MSNLSASASTPEASRRGAPRHARRLCALTPYLQHDHARRLMNLRHLLATSAATALLSPIAHAAGDTALTQPRQPADGTDLPAITVTDTRHLPESFDQRYATTQVLTRADLDRLSPSEPSITQALAMLPGVTVSQNGGPGR